MKISTRFFAAILVVGSLFASCKKEDTHIAYVNNQLFKLMREMYLWYDHLPVQPNPNDYSTPQAYMEALRYATYDKWSYVVTAEENQQYFEEGKAVGHGFSLGLDENDNVRIIFVYQNTEAATKGVKRGWILSKINGTNTPPDSRLFDLLGDDVPGVKNVLTFLDENGVTQTITLTKENYNITPVLHYEVINQGSDKIGYIVFQDFISNATEEINEAMNYFISTGINELVIDLRYNGGGMVNIANTFAGWLVGKNYGGQPFVFYEFNDKNSDANTVLNLPTNSNGLDLDRVFFIGSEYTASASEMLICGVKPYLGNVFIAGSSTHGKPVGMYGWEIDEYIAFPIVFRYYNKNHQGDFFGGIAPDIAADDDMTRDFGDPEEASLKAVLNYISDNSLPLKSATQSTHTTNRMIESKRPMGQFLKAY